MCIRDSTNSCSAQTVIVRISFPICRTFHTDAVKNRQAVTIIVSNQYCANVIYLCYWPAGRSVMGKTVPEVLSPYPRPRAQFFLIRSDLDRQITCLLFSSVEYFVGSFCVEFFCWKTSCCVEFSLQPFSNLMYACVWHLGNRKSTLRSFAFLCFLGHYLHFTFFAAKKNCWKRGESWKISSGPYAGSGRENPDRWSARN